jgi:hypothetical protein
MEYQEKAEDVNSETAYMRNVEACYSILRRVLH